MLDYECDGWPVPSDPGTCGHCTCLTCPYRKSLSSSFLTFIVELLPLHCGPLTTLTRSYHIHTSQFRVLMTRNFLRGCTSCVVSEVWGCLLYCLNMIGNEPLKGDYGEPLSVSKKQSSRIFRKLSDVRDVIGRPIVGCEYSQWRW